jgi:small-conductance mechanosensitive channel/CRP-like cAMP-binding protein
VEREFFPLWGRALLDERTPLLAGGLIALLILVQRLPRTRRPAVRFHVALVLAHVVALTGGAVAEGYGHAPKPYQIAALAFGLFAGIGIASTAAFRIILPRLGLALPRILVDIVSAVAVVVALIVVGQRMGFSVTGLITTSAVLTAVIGFALQDTLGNMMGGIALQLDQSINVGDWVALTPGAAPARVTEIRWRYTAMETQAWTTIIVPNSVLMKGQVTVLGRRQGQPTMMRRDVDFFVDFRTPPGAVIDPVRATLIADPPKLVAKVPELQVLYFGVRDSVNQYRVRYWLMDLAVDDPTDAEIRTRVYYALQRAGVDFSIPAQTVFVATQDDAREQRHADRETAARLGAIAKVDLLAMLGDDERRQLAGRLHYAPFHRGERMCREGDVDDGLYMIVEGHAAVQITTPDGAVEVARLGPGQFFGEMSLMTGEKRSATVVAASDCVTYRLDKHAFEDLIRSRPPIAEAVAELLTERKIGLDAARESVDDAARARRRQTTKQDILGRIRGFFALGR